MSCETIKFPVTAVARAVWESNQTVTKVAAGSGVVTRYLNAIFADEGDVNVKLVNQVSSFSEGFTLPISEDQVPVVELSRIRIRNASTLLELDRHLVLLDKVLHSAQSSQDVELEAMTHWQITYALHRAASFVSLAEAHRFQLRASSHADKMLAMMPRTQFKDGALMRVVALRNAATSAFVAKAAAGKVASKDELLRYLAAYDSAETEVAKSLPGIKGSVDRRNALLPMFRALALDRVELAAYTGDKELTDRAVLRLRAVGDCASGRVYQLAVNSIASDAMELLWRNAEWVSLMRAVNAAAAKHDGQLGS